MRGLFHRRYEQTLAVDQVSFTIEQGELVGFLGPNGAGKTTTLKMLSGLLHPTGGSARVLGYVPWERARRLPPAIRPVAGPEEPALVGPARPRIAGIERQDLRHARPTTFERTVAELTEPAGRAATSWTSWCASFRWANG